MQIVFDVSDWVSLYGEGTVVLLHQRKGDTEPYLVAVEQEDSTVTWTVTSADTHYAGNGKAELQYVVNDTLAKSAIYRTNVTAALSEPTEALDPETGWVAQLLADVKALLDEQGVDKDEVNSLIATYLEVNPVTRETPVYNLAELGIASVALIGGDESVACDTTDLVADLESGPVTFEINLSFAGDTIPITMTGHAAYANIFGLKAWEMTQVFFYKANILISVVVYAAGQVQVITTQLS